MLGGHGVFGPGSWVERTFQLPAHTAIRLQLTFIRVDAWADGDGQVFVDGNLAWQRPLSHRDRESTGACGTMGHVVNDEVPAQVDVTVAHYTESVTIRVTSSVTRGGWWTGDAYWGMNDFVLSAVTAHPSPPAPPLAPGIWTSNPLILPRGGQPQENVLLVGSDADAPSGEASGGATSDEWTPDDWTSSPFEDRWPGASGWHGTSLGVTTCGHLCAWHHLEPHPADACGTLPLTDMCVRWLVRAQWHHAGWLQAARP